MISWRVLYPMGCCMTLEVPYWPTRVCAAKGGLRRDGECEHGVLQQRAAGAAPLHEPPHLCLLMHVGAAQASTRR